MRLIITLIFACIVLIGCSSGQPESGSVIPAEDSAANENYFPVTTFIKGQIYTIKTELSNPVKVVIVGGRSDTSWVKMEGLEAELFNFITPVIDTANLKERYQQSSFLDQTINRYTFTYNLRNPSDTASLRTWTVYADGQSAKVVSITMEKILPGNQKLLLSLFPENYAKEILIKNDKIIKEQTLTWNQAKDE